MDVAIIQIDLRRFDRRLRRFHLRLVHINGILLRVVVLFGNSAGSHKFLVARKLNLRKLQCRLHLREVGLRGIELRFVGPGIDYKDKLTFFQVFAVLEMPLYDLPAYLRSHVHRFKGRVSADFVQIARHVLSLCLGHGHQRRRQCRRALGSHVASAARNAQRGNGQQQHRAKKFAAG